MAQFNTNFKSFSGSALPKASFGNGQYSNPNFDDEATLHALMSELIHAKASLEVEIEKFDRQTGRKANNQQRVIVNRGVNQCRNIAKRLIAELDSKAALSAKAEMQKRWFQTQENIYRPIHQPDHFVTGMLIALGFTAETAFTAMSLFADGHMDLISSMGFAAVFSSVNVGLGLQGGFLCRYWGRQNTSFSPSRSLRSKLARIGVCVSVLVHGVMNFTAGRVRVTGGHDEIFDFDKVGFLATFNDGMALIIMVAALLSYIMAMVKGYCGLFDPHPEYQLYTSSGEADFDEAEGMFANAQDDVEDILEEAHKALQELNAEQEKVSDLSARVATHNANIEIAKQQHLAIEAKNIERIRFLTGSCSEPCEPALNSFDALKLPFVSISSNDFDDGLNDALLEAHSEAVTQMSEALSAFYDAVNDHRTPPSFI